METKYAVDSAILALYGLPTSYSGHGYTSTAMSKPRQQEVEDKIDKAPVQGLLTVSGTAAPVVNQLIKGNRKVRGINFLDRNGAAFEVHENPEASVVILYNVGTEVSLNSKVPGMVLRNIIKHYSDCNTLLIIETNLSRGDLLSRYDFNTPNFLSIPRKPEEAWA